MNRAFVERTQLPSLTLVCLKPVGKVTVGDHTIPGCYEGHKYTPVAECLDFGHLPGDAATLVSAKASRKSLFFCSAVVTLNSC